MVEEGERREKDGLRKINKSYPLVTTNVGLTPRDGGGGGNRYIEGMGQESGLITTICFINSP